MGLIEEKLQQAQTKKRKRIEAGRDPIVAGWQCALEEMIIRLEAYLRPGELVTFKMLTPEEKKSSMPSGYWSPYPGTPGRCSFHPA